MTTHHRLRNAFFLLALTGLLLAPLGIGQDTGLGVEKFKVKLLGVESSYGQEKWKTSPMFGPRSPQDDAARYDQAIGYRLILRIQLTDEQGNNVPADPIENRNVNLTATIQTSRGNIPAYVQRMPGTIPGQSDSLVFKLHFDLDGAVGVPGRAAIPALESGTATVRVNIFKQSANQARVDAGHDELAFSYQRPSSTITVDAFGERDYIAEVPDPTFRLLNDIGDGSTVPFITDQVPDTTTLRATYAFGVAGKRVRWLALTPTPCSSANCAPINGAAATDVLSRELGIGDTDATGNVSFSIGVKELLTYAGRPALPAALVVVAAALVPEEGLPPELGTQYAKGSYDIIGGADEFVIPISNRVARVTGFSISTELQERAPLTASVNNITVKLYDDAGTASGLGCTNCGDAVAIVPDGTTGVLDRGIIHSVADPVLANKYREATLLTRGIRDSKTPWYRVLALFYGSSGNGERDVFQGMTYADRGVIIETASMPTRITESGTYYFNITSVTTNYDLRAREPEFRMKVLYRIATESGQYKNDSIVLEEGGVTNQVIKTSSSRVGSLAIHWEATTGDILVGPNTDTAVFHDKAPKKRLGIPGFEALIVAAALVSALVLLRRREAF